MTDLNALYSYQGQEPRPLPHEIFYTESWGGTNFRQGVESFTDEEIQRAGYTGPYTRPEYNQEYQRRHWNSETLSYVIEDKTDEEIWESIRRERNRLLAESDWTMAVDIPGEINLPEWEKYRQRLRDLPTTFSDPKKVIWPESPDKATHFDLEPVVEPRLRWRIGDLETAMAKLEYRVYKPFISWSWNENENKWEAPIAPPVDYDGKNYIWSEIYQEWKLLSSIIKSDSPNNEYIDPTLSPTKEV